MSELTPEVEAEIERLSILAHDAAINKIEELDDYLFLVEQQGLEEDEEPPESVAPYDGCTTCQVREALDAAWPHLKELALYMVIEGIE